ncbi:prominin-like protein isoform X2 [Amphibalanus amphitrite]|uniref:prominin-like protein isoform X2 n=1 Tax=Amphibalanus amphitrite TaxID=1232801 RepID=UPI001C9029B6|nr:prominin-like protein isoform X2 [Amphibalanus amphitrite]
MWGGAVRQVVAARGVPSRPCVRMCVFVAVLVTLCVGVSHAQTSVPPPGVGEVVYSKPQLNTSYRASTEFDPQGMEHLYYVTNMFLDVIQKDDVAALDKQQLEEARKEGTLIETLVELGLYDWQDLVHHHIGYAVLAGGGIVLALLLPFVGLVVCCCRCSGRCGGRVQSYDKKKDGCRRWCLGISLCMMVLVILFGVVASFVVNEYVERGVTEIPPRLHVAVDDSELYVHNTKQEVNHLLKKNYMELTEVLDQSLEECGVRIERQLADISQAAAVDNLTAIAEGLTVIKDELQSIGRQSVLLQNKADQLQVGLQDARAELAVLLRSCSSPRCRQLAAQYNLTQLVVHNEFKRLPDLSRWAREVTALIEAGIEAEVRRGQLALNQLSQKIQTEVAAVVPEVRQGVSRAGIQLQEVANNISTALDQVQLQPVHTVIDQGNHYLQQYGTFRYYIFVIISGLVSLIVFCMVIGLFCGMCGRRPDNVYGDDTCNKGTGANFLISGTFFFFLFGWLLLLLITCMFLLGGLTQLYLCDGLVDPSAPGSGLPILEAVYPLETVFPALENAGDVADVVRRCHQNQSIYSVLRLESLFNVSEVRGYKYQMELDQKLEALRQQITVDTAVELLTSRARDQLAQLARSDLDQLNYTAFTVALEEEITTIDMNPLGDELERASQELPSSERSVATRLRNQAIILKAQQRVVAGMEEIVQDIRNSTASLQEHILTANGSLPDVVRKLTETAEAAERYLRTSGRDLVVKLADQFTAEFSDRLDGYSERVERSFHRTLGSCEPISTVYNATTVTLCSNVIYPFNAFWAAIGWCLLLFIPCVILSLALTPLYRKAEPFSDGLMDADYPYDAYGDHDNIPLASVRGSGGERRRGRSNDLSRGGYSPESPSYSAIPPRGQLYPLGATGVHTEDTEPKAPPMWDMTMTGGPPGYPDSPQPTREHPPPYSPSETPMLGHA